jgi:hypothetical protein
MNMLKTAVLIKQEEEVKALVGRTALGAVEVWLSSF